jgi:CheY-like chemotaxis protein
VHAIIIQLGGQIQVDSVVGLGSVFTMHFPAAVAEPAPPVATLPVRWAPRGSILVVEDDPAVRLYVESALSQQGYLVQGASDGLLALEAALESTPVDLLLADVVLPGMSGHHLAERLRDYFPSLKVVYMSGYSESIVMSESVMNAQFLSKPFNVSTLLDKVQLALSV